MVKSNTKAESNCEAIFWEHCGFANGWAPLGYTSAQLCTLNGAESVMVTCLIQTILGVQRTYYKLDSQMSRNVHKYS